MNSLQLYKLIQRDKTLKKMFCGFYNADDILPREYGFFIVNTDKRDGYGKHWVVFFINNEYTEFFDSCGEDSNYYGLTETQEFNSFRLQGDEPVCGYYCLYYCLMRCRYMEMNKIVFNLKKIKKSYRDFYIANKVLNHFITLENMILFKVRRSLSHH
jgi:hypothetical protein